MLNGCKDMCFDVSALVELDLVEVAIVIADNTDQPPAKPYLAHIHPGSGYVGVSAPCKKFDSISVTRRAG